MSIFESKHDYNLRGPTDAARHRAKVKEAIRGNLPDIISEESIITRKGDVIVKVPIKGVKSYHFKHDQGLGGGFGSGETEDGKIIGRRQNKSKDGKPGDEAGEDYLETEIDLAELIQMMFQDMGLPNLQKKEIQDSLVANGWKRDTFDKHGIPPRIDKKRTIKEAIKRIEILVYQLVEECGQDEETCREILEEAGFDIDIAREIIINRANNNSCSLLRDLCLPIESSDLRFRTITEDFEEQSRAVVLAMMDVSGSMGTMKKYLARSFYFWMVSFLKVFYKRVEIRFIAHTTEAKLVDEDTFFHRGESGGTFCGSAYNLASEMIDTEYSTSKWNVYPFHFSDGEDWNPTGTVEALRRLLSRGVSTFGYGEIIEDWGGRSTGLFDTYAEQFKMEGKLKDKFVYYHGLVETSPMISVGIHGKDQLYPALKVFLNIKD